MKLILIFLIHLSLFDYENKKVIKEQVLSLKDSLQSVTKKLLYTPKAGKANQITFSLDHTDVYQKGLVIVMTSNQPTMSFDLINAQEKSFKIETFSLDGNIILLLDPKTLSEKLGIRDNQHFLKIIPKLDRSIKQFEYSMTFVYPQQKVPLITNIEYFLHNPTGVVQLQLDFLYEGHQSIHTLRYQQTFFHEPENSSYQASITDNKSKTYVCNKIFRNILAGVIHDQQIPICKDKFCNYLTHLQL